MKILTSCLVFAIMLLSCDTPDDSADFFVHPERGFISTQPADNWAHGLLTGNGTTGAIINGNPFNETITLSHESLYLPYENNDDYMEMASHLEEIRELSLAGKFIEATEMVPKIREEQSYFDIRDPFIAAFNLQIQQPDDSIIRYQRSVNFMTAEAKVSVEGQQNSFQRTIFASRSHDIVVVRLKGREKLSAKFSFDGLVPQNEDEQKIVDEGIKSKQEGVKDGFLYFHTLFASSNSFNPNVGYEGVGKVFATGGSLKESEEALEILDAQEILLLIKIRPILKADAELTNFRAITAELNSFDPDYDQLLKPHSLMHGDLMGRVSLSLNATEENRSMSNEELFAQTATKPNPLAMIERAFDAGRYNIICSSGHNPPNLQGIWSSTWLANWSGSFTTNGNLQCAVAFQMMGNTPELMEGLFRYYDNRWDQFRENARLFKGTRGFHVPAQLTVSPRSTNFTHRHPHCYWHSGAAWALQFYYDYYQYTGDKKFLEERAYPLMKEAAEFYEDFLIKPDVSDKLAFVPSYSPENSPLAQNMSPAAINATMDISAAKQLLGNLIEASRILNRDADMQAKWSQIISNLPDYEVGPDGSFREWLWQGLDDNHAHRHASQLYALYDEQPSEIVNNPELVDAVEFTIRERFKHHQERPVMAFGLVQIGLAAANIGNEELTQEIINFLVDGYWTTGMGSFHNRNELFNTDISGGFPYLCASSLVYSESGYIRFFPARPDQWQSGSIKGLLLRGGITLKELSWEGEKAKAVLITKNQQTVTIENANGMNNEYNLFPGKEILIDI